MILLLMCFSSHELLVLTELREMSKPSLTKCGIQYRFKTKQQTASRVAQDSTKGQVFLFNCFLQKAQLTSQDICLSFCLLSLNVIGNSTLATNTLSSLSAKRNLRVQSIEFCKVRRCDRTHEILQIHGIIQYEAALKYLPRFPFSNLPSGKRQLYFMPYLLDTPI